MIKSVIRALLCIAGIHSWELCADLELLLGERLTIRRSERKRVCRRCGLLQRHTNNKWRTDIC